MQAAHLPGSHARLIRGDYAGVCIFEAGRLLSQVPLRDLQEDEELNEERAVGQVMSNLHKHGRPQLVLLLLLRPRFLHEET